MREASQLWKARGGASFDFFLPQESSSSNDLGALLGESFGLRSELPPGTKDRELGDHREVIRGPRSLGIAPGRDGDQVEGVEEKVDPRVAVMDHVLELGDAGGPDGLTHGAPEGSLEDGADRFFFEVGVEVPGQDDRPLEGLDQGLQARQLVGPVGLVVFVLSVTEVDRDQPKASLEAWNRDLGHRRLSLRGDAFLRERPIVANFEGMAGDHGVPRAIGQVEKGTLGLHPVRVGKPRSPTDPSALINSERAKVSPLHLLEGRHVDFSLAEEGGDLVVLALSREGNMRDRGPEDRVVPKSGRRANVVGRNPNPRGAFEAGLSPS